LQDANLVESTKVGKWTYYKRNSTVVEQVLATLREVLSE